MPCKIAVIAICAATGPIAYLVSRYDRLTTVLDQVVLIWRCFTWTLSIGRDGPGPRVGAWRRPRARVAPLRLPLILLCLEILIQPGEGCTSQSSNRNGCPLLKFSLFATFVTARLAAMTLQKPGGSRSCQARSCNGLIASRRIQCSTVWRPAMRSAVRPAT